ncbi:KH domain-containing protein, partial [Aliarcobacter butzleri]|nr:KH domain-containing protein [Aliarcobacter butzleri]
LLTKIDFVSADELMLKLKEYEKYNDKYEAIIPVSIKKATKKADILGEVVKYLPEHPYLYDPEIMTTEHLRDIFKEFIRESIFENISDEIPYEADVIVNKVEEKPNVDVIKATIIVQKDTQKGMIIGKGATAIKRIGRDARMKIEKLTGKKCFLELFVSIKKGWTKDKEGLKALGYDVNL